MQAIGQLATRKYQGRCRQASRWDSASSCSSAPVCAICLEEFSEGQVGCGHGCWLATARSFPAAVRWELSSLAGVGGPWDVSFSNSGGLGKDWHRWRSSCPLAKKALPLLKSLACTFRFPEEGSPAVAVG